MVSSTGIVNNNILQDMVYVKGQSGNPKGRPKGAANRTTSEVQAALLRLLDENLDNLSDDIKNLKGKERANLLLGIAKHVVPAAVNPEKLTEEQLLQVLEYLKQKRNG